MKLNTYLEKYKIPVQIFAEMCGVSRSAIYRILFGCDVSLSLAFRINDESKGIVQLKDLLITEDRRKGKKKSKVLAENNQKI